MSRDRDRYWTVEATTPDGDVELVGASTGNARKSDVVKDIVDDYANQSGFTVEDIKVTHAWSVAEQ